MKKHTKTTNIEDLIKSNNQQSYNKQNQGDTQEFHKNISQSNHLFRVII